MFVQVGWAQTCEWNFDEPTWAAGTPAPKPDPTFTPAPVDAPVDPGPNIPDQQPMIDPAPAPVAPVPEPAPPPLPRPD